MTEQEVNRLIERYFEGETSLDEERALKQYFATHQAATPDQLAVAQWLGFAHEEAQVQMSLEPRSPGILKPVWKRMAWAAAFVLGISLTGWFVLDKVQTQNKALAARQRLYEDHYDDPQKALAEVQAALALVGKKMHKGQTTTQKGLKQIQRLAIVK